MTRTEQLLDQWGVWLVLTLGAVVLFLGCPGLGSPTASIPADAQSVSTAWGEILAAGCSLAQRSEIPFRVGLFFRPYPVGYGGTVIERRYSVAGLTVVCDSTPGTCYYYHGNRVALCQGGGLVGLTHELGHDAAYRGAAEPGVDWSTVHHAGGTDLFGKRCANNTAGPCG